MKNDESIKGHYQYQAAYERKVKLENRLPPIFSSPDSIDAWRHDRMRDLVLPFIKNEPQASWLTLGDGMFGSDAYYLERKGAKVVASSLSDETLAVAQKNGFIQKYRIINAENIEEANEAFDYVYCKEAFHHFPRPYLALYEMLRVSKNAVILIEPQEPKARPLNFLKKVIKKIWRKDDNTDFEVTGNFIYRLNVPEVIKIMTALDLRHMAYYKFNDFFLPSIAKGSRKGFNRHKLIFKLGLGFQNTMCTLGLIDYGLACVVLFKGRADEALWADLKQNGFTMKVLPKNPYQ